MNNINSGQLLKRSDTSAQSEVRPVRSPGCFERFRSRLGQYRVLAGVCVIFLMGCSFQTVDSQAPIQIDGMAIENQTRMWVTAVRMMVPVTGNFVSCGNIAPGSMCSTTFPETNYSGNPVEITWSQGGQIYSTGEFVLQLPLEVDERKAAAVRVVIAGPGSAGAVVIQD